VSHLIRETLGRGIRLIRGLLARCPTCPSRIAFTREEHVRTHPCYVRVLYWDRLGQWDKAFHNIQFHDFGYLGQNWDKPGLLLEEAGRVSICCFQISMTSVE